MIVGVFLSTFAVFGLIAWWNGVPFSAGEPVVIGLIVIVTAVGRYAGRRPVQ